MIHRLIPSSGEPLPVIGMGTWQTFDVPDEQKYPVLTDVLNTFAGAGGRLIDSSPMYGMSEKVVGDLTSVNPHQQDFFYATKVWINGETAGIEQMEASMRKMQRKTMDLIQIHNLLDWRTHLDTLKRWKAEGKVRYIGITHYTDEFHPELERIISTETIDFVQFNYSILARNAENRLLPAAAANGVATLINRPLAVGDLFNKVKGKKLPPWAADLDIHTWAAYFLKYIIAHPAVTCIIPATGDPAHAADNLASGEGVLPDEAARKKMADHLLGIA